MDDLALVAVHGLKADFGVDAAGLLGEMAREAAQRLFAAAAVVHGIEDDVDAAVFAPFVRGEVREVLQGIERLAVLADEDAEAVALEVVDGAFVGLLERHGDVEAHAAEDFAEEFLGALTRREIVLSDALIVGRDGDGRRRRLFRCSGDGVFVKVAAARTVFVIRSAVAA